MAIRGPVPTGNGTGRRGGSRLGVALITLALWAATGVALPAIGRVPGRSDLQLDRTLVDRALDASGVPAGAEREAWAARFESRVLPLVAEARKSRSDFKAARRLHDLLHHDLFLKYRFDADGLEEILVRGEYNCVSAALTEGIAAAALGIEVRVVETPRHLSLRMELRGRGVDVEPASSRGFDRHWPGRRARGFLLAYKLATPEELAADPAAVVDAYRQVRPGVNLEEAVAFLRYNRALRLIDRGEAAEGAREMALALSEHPPFRERSDEAGVAFARAFREAYDAGRFPEALEIARLDLGALPSRVSGQDRFVAAAVKSVEALTEGGNLDGAETLMDALRVERPELAPRLDRGVCTLVVLASVRSGDFDRAQRLAARFDATNPGMPESASLATWVRSHRAPGAPASRRGAPASR